MDETQKTEVSESQVSDFAQILGKNWQAFSAAFEEKYQTPQEKQRAMSIFNGLTKEGRIEVVMNLGDELRIEKMRKEDPSFNRFQSFARGFDSVVTFGAVTKASDAMINDAGDFGRLINKAYPMSKATGVVTGFLVPLFGQAGLAGKGVQAARSSMTLRTGADIFFSGMKARAYLGKYVEQILGKAGLSEGLTLKMAKAIQSTSKAGKAIDMGVGSAAFGAGQELVDTTSDTIKGENPNIGKIASRVGTDFAMGTVFGAGFEAIGPAARAVKGMVSKSAQMGASFIWGKPIRYQIEHVDAIRQAVKETPTAFIGKAAQEVQVAAKRIEGELVAVQDRYKNEILAAVDAKKNELTSALRTKEFTLGEEIKRGASEAGAKLQGSSDEFFSAVNDLRKATGEDVATASTKVVDTFRNSYKKVNESYRDQLANSLAKAQERLGGAVPRIDNQKVLSVVEDTLKKKGAFEGGRPLTGSEFAKTETAFFNDLVYRWEALGGPTKLRGGTPGTMAVEDAINLKKSIGEMAHFGPGPNFEQATYNKIYGTLRKDIEKAVPEISPVNAWYSEKRGQIDLFRERIGRSEKSVASFLRKKYQSGATELELEGIKALGATSPEAALETGKALALREQVQALAGFPNGEVAARSTILKAYVNEDAVFISKLDGLARRFPKIRPKLDVLQKQAEAVRSMRDAAAADKAITDPLFEGRLLQARPDLQPLIAEARALQLQIDTLPTSQIFTSTEAAQGVQNILPQTKNAFEKYKQSQEQVRNLREVIPRSDLGLDRRLASDSFGTMPAEKRVIEGQISEVSGALERAEAGRMAQTLMTGEGMKKEGFLETLPIIGEALFSMRRATTPMASRLIDKLVTSSPSTKGGLFASIIESLQGSTRMDLNQLRTVVKAAGAESALLLYLQTEDGRKDFERALSMVGEDLFK